MDPVAVSKELMMMIQEIANKNRIMISSPSFFPLHLNALSIYVMCKILDKINEFERQIEQIYIKYVLMKTVQV